MISKRWKVVFFILLGCAVIASFIFFPYDGNFAVLNPKGWVGLKQRNLLVIATLLMLIVVFPVVVMTLFFVWKYRSSNRKATYRPDWDYSFLAESIWWGFPLLIIIVLSILTWKSSHELDPYKPLESTVKPVTIQVVALQWKWLFIYPEYNIATVNFIQFPEQTPINFQITSDAPMNSFWIPELGGQIYAMEGMMTKLHLIADEPGNFRGCSANISGSGFAGMTFVAKASSQSEFDAWVESVKQSPKQLDVEEYNKLAEPTEYHPVELFVLKDATLFDWTVMKYVMPQRVKYE